MGESVIEVTKDRFQGLSKVAVDASARTSFLRSFFYRCGLLSLLIVLTSFGAAVVRADTTTNAAGEIVAQLCPLLDNLTEASISVAQSDRTSGSTQLGLTLNLVDGLMATVQSPDMTVALGNKNRTLQKSLSRFQSQILRAKSAVDNSTTTSAAALRAMVRALTQGQQVKALLPTLPSSDTEVMLSEVRSSTMTLHYSGDTVCFHVNILNATGDPSCGPVTVSVDPVGGSPTDVLTIGAPNFSSDTDFCLTMGPDAGTVQVTVGTCNQTNSLLLYDYGVPKRSGPALPAPVDLSAPMNTFGSIELAWSYHGASAAGFKVERSPTPTGPWTPVGVTNSNTYVDAGLSDATIYYYRLRAYNSTGYSLYSNEAMTLSPASTPPAAPSNLAVMVVRPTSITLNWQDNADNELGFQIQRATSPGGPWSVAGTVGTGVTSYTDTGLDPSTTYYYEVAAFN